MLPTAAALEAASNSGYRLVAGQLAERHGALAQLQVDVHAEQANDLYAYELIATYDRLRLKLISVNAGGNPGLSTEPIHSSGQIRLAHTLIGPVPGRNGDVKLATLTFARIRGGEAEIRLEQVKAVSADLTSRTEKIRQSYLWNDPEASQSAELVDVQGHWAEKDILQAVELGFVTGYGDLRFHPDRPATRAEFAVMLGRALLLEAEDGPEVRFVDKTAIPNWSLTWINRLVLVGLIRGYEDGTYRPDATINRAEMATMLARALTMHISKGEVADGAAANTAVARYTDFSLIPDWAREAVGQTTASGLVSGRGQDRFEPQAPTTRAEAVRVLLGLLESVA